MNTPVEIETHLQVRDDAHILFGFKDKKIRSYLSYYFLFLGLGLRPHFR